MSQPQQTMFMDLAGVDSLPTGMTDYNQSIEGDFWSTAGAPIATGGNEPSIFDQTSGAENSEMFLDTQQYKQTNNTQQQVNQFLASPPAVQAQQQHPPMTSYQPTAVPQGPPAHLFATPFSPFQHATFEVENDLNGVNPSNLFLNAPGVNAPAPYNPQQQQPPVPAPSTMGRGLSETQNMQFAPHVGQIPSQPMNISYDQYESPQSANSAPRQPQQHRATSQSSTATAAAAPAPSSRKRQRGPTGAAQASTVYRAPPEDDEDEVEEVGPDDELRNLQDSTFSIPTPSGRGARNGASPAAHHQQQQMVFPSDMSDGEQKKVKHQMTDRQRRAKIKESMDALKKLVPLEPNQKADQATIVASSVTTISSLKDEVAELRAKLQQMEIDQKRENNKFDQKRNAMRQATGHAGNPQAQQAQQQQMLSNSPFTSMMASLNGAGVSMWRIGLTGKIIEVNLVFELVSGFSAAEIIGNTPCGKPLYGSLSIMPSAFLKAFSEASAIPQASQPQLHQQQQQNQLLQQGHSEYELQQLHHPQHGQMIGPNGSIMPGVVPQQHHTPINNGGSSSSSSCSTTPQLEFPSPHTPSVSTPNSHATQRNNSTSPHDPTTPVTQVKQEIHVNPTSTSQATSQASVAPLYANASISNFPVVPQTELENFFPYKCKALINAHTKSMDSKATLPQPHGNFLVAHLAALPYNHVLKLLCRHHTLWGEILESIVTLCLVRDAAGQPDYIMLLSTPDCRRLLTPATHNKMDHQPLVACTDMRVDGTTPFDDDLQPDEYLMA